MQGTRLSYRNRRSPIFSILIWTNKELVLLLIPLCIFNTILVGSGFSLLIALPLTPSIHSLFNLFHRFFYFLFHYSN